MLSPAWKLWRLLILMLLWLRVAEVISGRSCSRPWAIMTRPWIRVINDSGGRLGGKGRGVMRVGVIARRSRGNGRSRESGWRGGYKCLWKWWHGRDRKTGFRTLCLGVRASAHPIHGPLALHTMICTARVSMGGGDTTTPAAAATAVVVVIIIDRRRRVPGALHPIVLSLHLKIRVILCRM